MKSKERLIEALNYLKTQDPSLSNPDISRALKYETDNYVTDIIAGRKKVTPLFLKRLNLEYSINTDWVQTGRGKMIDEGNDQAKMIKGKGDPSVVNGVDYHEKYIKTLEDDKKRYLRIIESSLKNIASDQQYFHAEFRAAVKRATERFVQDNHEQADQELHKIGKYAAEYMGLGAKAGIAPVDDNSNKIDPR